eukprot:5272637-Alexandrium_andersonii.AAC.1
MTAVAQSAATPGASTLEQLRPALGWKEAIRASAGDACTRRRGLRSKSSGLQGRAPPRHQKGWG